MDIKGDCINYDTVRCGANKIDSFEIKSTGTAPLTISKIWLSNKKTPPFTFLSDTANIIINPNSSKFIKVQFNPITVGLVQDTVIVLSNAALNNPDSVCLRGVGKGACLSIINPLAGEFDSVKVGTPPVYDTIRFQSSCNDTLKISAVTLTGSSTFTMYHRPANNSFYLPGSGDSIVVEYFPQKMEDTYGNITITSNSITPIVNVGLHGKGVSSVDVENKQLSPGFYLGQNYPNPFSRLSVVGYRLSEGVINATLDVRDILGKIIYSTSVIGERAIALDAAQWQPGVYFYSLRGYPKSVRIMMVMK